MPTWRNKPPNREYLNKRHSPAKQQALMNAAREATRRLYCDVLEVWRRCADKRCRRHLRCAGDATACFRRLDSSAIGDATIDAVIAGGPRRLPPATHTEWGVRRWPPSSV
jgi:hypothetical protein